MDTALTTAIGLFLSLVSIVLAIFTLPGLKKEEVSNVIWSIIGVFTGLFLVTIWVLGIVIPFLYKLDNGNDLTSFWLVSTYILITFLLPILTYQSGQIRGHREALRLKEKR